MHSLVSSLRALGDETRIRILRLLDESEDALCVCELVDILRKPQYAVSRSLGILRSAGLVEEHRGGKLMFYRPADTPQVKLLMPVTRSMPASEEPVATDLDRLRWRLDLRANGECRITYTVGSNPDAYSAIRARRERLRVLFVCVHNTARSQMAEEYLNAVAGDRIAAESAGIEPGELNPHVVRLLAEEGRDISGKRTRAVADVYRSGQTYDYVITVCSPEAEENCPVFPGPVTQLSWPFPDPGAFTGTSGEILRQTRAVYRSIQNRINEFLTEIDQSEQSRLRGA